MSIIKVGIVDYGFGNHASVEQCFRKIGFRPRVSNDLSVIDSCDIILIPGVGAFPPAMQALNEMGFASYLKATKKAIIGICLGMQLLTDGSSEFCYTKGLGLIPGECHRLSPSPWHIGWNAIHWTRSFQIPNVENGSTVYFNHSYAYQGADQYCICESEAPEKIKSIIRKGRAVGIQFHPEKSQDHGRMLLKGMVEELLHA